MRTTYISGNNKRGKIRIDSTFFKQKFVVITLGFTYLLGMIIGRITAQSAQKSNDTIGIILTNFIKSRTDQTLWQNFLSSFLSTEFCLIILFISGFCAIGIPLIYAAVFFKGLGPGLSLSVILGKMGWKGISASLIMLPGIVGTAIIIIIAARISIHMVGLVFGDSGGRSKQEVKEISPKYWLQYAIFTVFIAAISLLDGLLFYLFGGIILK